eukprot:NODE_9821_length_202_cov_8.424837_g9738_i0.p1 GENE.NODE_9821_length_202_cov_8.424837_g9738_i0~~NODE_9821_length_202_cov_8.424837_g9738_i0.p1  ORF type:complete len:57 (-),score=21.19 NODE_9821_length_202_cov_8.424837_g9738_i0:32-181(-)
MGKEGLQRVYDWITPLVAAEREAGVDVKAKYCSSTVVNAKPDELGSKKK